MRTKGESNDTNHTFDISTRLEHHHSDASQEHFIHHPSTYTPWFYTPFASYTHHFPPIFVNELPFIQPTYHLETSNEGIGSTSFTEGTRPGLWHSKNYEDRTLKPLIDAGFHGPYISNKKWLMDPHEYFMPKETRKTRGWEGKIQQLSKRDMIVVFDDVEFISSEGFIFLVTQDQGLIHLLPYAISIYVQERYISLNDKVNSIGYLQKNQDPYVTRSMDPIRNISKRSHRSQKHNPRKHATHSQATSPQKNPTSTSMESQNHKRTILKKANEPSGTTSSTLSELNRKVVHAILDIYNVFPQQEGIEEPESIHDALVLCLTTLLKARFHRFVIKDKRVDIYMKDVLKDVLEDKDLRTYILHFENAKLAQDLERILTKNPEFAAELFLISDMSVEKWRMLRSFLVHKYSPLSKCPLPSTVNDIPLPALWPSYNRVEEGMKCIDSKLPQYKKIEDLPNPGQIGYTFRREDFSIALSRILKSDQKLHFEKKDLTISLDDYSDHLKELESKEALGSQVTRNNVDSVTFKDVPVLKFLFCGDGYRDMPFASEEFKKKKIACFGVLENFVDGRALQLFSNAWLLAFGEGIEDDVTVRKYCEDLFRTFEDFVNKGFLFKDAENGSYTLYKFEISFVFDYKFLCLLLGIHTKICWRCNGELESWWEHAPSRTLQQMISDFKDNKPYQKQLPLSVIFALESFLSDPVHFSSAVGRGLISDITAKAIKYDNETRKAKVLSHLVHRYFSKDTESIPVNDDYVDFLKLFMHTVPPLGTEKLIDNCYKKWSLFVKYGAFSLDSSPTIVAIQQIFKRTKSGINIFGQEITEKPNKANVMGWHTAIILHLMPEIGKLIGLSSHDLVRYNAMRKFIKIIHKRKLDHKYVQRARVLYLTAFKDYEFTKKKTYVMLGWHFVHDIEKGEIPGRRTCQRGERGNSEMKRTRVNHSNNLSTLDIQPHICNETTSNTISEVERSEKVDETLLEEHEVETANVSPWDVLHELDFKSSQDKEQVVIDYIYQTIRAYNRKQWVYSKYCIGSKLVSQSDRLKNILKKIREGNYAKFDKRLAEIYRQTPMTCEAPSQDRTGPVTIKFQKTASASSSSAKLTKKKTTSKNQNVILIDLKSCKNIEELTQYRIVDLKATASANSIDIGNKRKKQDIVDIIWLFCNEEQRPLKRPRLGEELDLMVENSQISLKSGVDIPEHSQVSTETEINRSFIDMLKNECTFETSDVVTQRFSISLTSGDLSRFAKQDGLLNDQCIDFYLQMTKIKLKDSPDYNHLEFLNSFFYTKLVSNTGYNFEGVEKWTKSMSIFSRNCTIIIPVHIENHWILAIIKIDVHPDIRIHIQLYDSLSMSENKNVMKNLERYIQDMYIKVCKSSLQASCIRTSYEACVQQTNSYDCGIFTIANAISVCLDLNPMIYGYDVLERMGDYREKLCLDCRNGMINSFHL